MNMLDPGQAVIADIYGGPRLGTIIKRVVCGTDWSADIYHVRFSETEWYAVSRWALKKLKG